MSFSLKDFLDTDFESALEAYRYLEGRLEEEEKHIDQVTIRAMMDEVWWHLSEDEKERVDTSDKKMT